MLACLFVVCGGENQPANQRLINTQTNKQTRLDQTANLENTADLQKELTKKRQANKQNKHAERQAAMHPRANKQGKHANLYKLTN